VSPSGLARSSSSAHASDDDDDMHAINRGREQPRSDQQHQSAHSEDDDSYSDESDASASGGEEDSDGPGGAAAADERPHSDSSSSNGWDVRVTSGQHVRVQVQYERPGRSPAVIGASSSSSSSAAAALDPEARARERDRLFPHGLPGMAAVAEPGAQSSRSETSPSSAAHSASDRRWDPTLRMSEDDARRIARIARIMQEPQSRN